MAKSRGGQLQERYVYELYVTDDPRPESKAEPLLYGDTANPDRLTPTALGLDLFHSSSADGCTRYRLLVIDGATSKRQIRHIVMPGVLSLPLTQSEDDLVSQLTAIGD